MGRKQMFSAKNRPTLITALIVTALVVGVGIYSWQQYTVKKLRVTQDYLTNIWEGSPKDCKNDLDCLAAAAQTCSPAQGKFSTSFTTVFGDDATVKYKMGIQGHTSNGCRMFFKRFESQASDNYFACIFQKSSDLAARLQKRQFISDTGSFEMFEEPRPVYTCERYEVIEPTNGIKNITSHLLTGEIYEDASENVSIKLRSMIWPKSANFLLTSNGEQVPFMLADKQEKTILGYTIKLDEFGQTNALLDSDNDPTTFRIQYLGNAVRVFQG